MLYWAAPWEVHGPRSSSTSKEAGAACYAGSSFRVKAAISPNWEESSERGSTNGSARPCTSIGNSDTLGVLAGSRWDAAGSKFVFIRAVVRHRKHGTSVRDGKPRNQAVFCNLPPH